MSREVMVYRPNHPDANDNGMVPRDIAGPLPQANSAPMIMGDLPVYRSVAADIATGQPAVIGGRRQHREFLARNGYVEVGNERVTPRREELSRAERITDIKLAIEK